MKDLAQVIGFQAKENSKNIFIKKYLDGYVIEIDFNKIGFHKNSGFLLPKHKK